MNTAEKKVDAKGRLVITELAGELVQVEALNEDEFIVRRMKAIPAREVWLHQNPAAMEMVQKGLHDLNQRQLVADPTEGKDYNWLTEEDDD
jgi:hypothetical protein